MITVFVQFKLPQAVAPGQAREIFLAGAPQYREIPGLIRKYYVLSEDGLTGGGVYLWKDREHADRLYTEQWRSMVRGKYGTDPVLTYFNCPVVVDNVLEKIIAD